jgi:hypothetical protein
VPDVLLSGDHKRMRRGGASKANASPRARAERPAGSGEPSVLHRKPVALSWSGGKDSALALHALLRDRTVDVAALVTTITSGMTA